MPRVPTGLSLYGEYRGSGFAEPQYIARRADGQVLQLSRLLHLVVSEIDGRRTLTEIARNVAPAYGREVSADNVGYVVQRKLVPMGLVDAGPRTQLPRSQALVPLTLRRVLMSAPAVQRPARALAWLHQPVVVVGVLLGFVALDVWLFGIHGGIEPLLAVLDEPGFFLVLTAFLWLSILFHEFGHASACHYGGATPGAIGFAVFIVWPVLYTDVTDVYRLRRGGRLRTDLGGVYFDVICLLAMGGCYFATGEPVFLAAVVLGHPALLDQLIPFIRFDGYYILGDIAGVPDLAGRIGPILSSMVPGRPVDPRVAMLRRSSRIAVTAWVAVLVPVIAAFVAYGLYHLPLILRTWAQSLGFYLQDTARAVASEQWAAAAGSAISVVFLCLPTLGLLYVLTNVARLLWRWARKQTEGRPRRRAAVAVVSAVVVVGLVASWVY